MALESFERELIERLHGFQIPNRRQERVHRPRVFFSIFVKSSAKSIPSLDVAVLQQMDADGVLIGNVRAELGRDASLRCVAVTLGGDVVRLSTSVDYTAPGGSVELLGAFFTTDGAHHEHRQFVDHSVPDCSSDVVYKGLEYY